MKRMIADVSSAWWFDNDDGGADEKKAKRIEFLI